MRMSTGLGLCLAVLAASAGPVLAQPAPSSKPVQVSDFPLPTVERLGLELYFQDQLAWKASDALTEAKHDLKGLRGWIVIDERPVFRVRFIRGAASGVEAAYDVVYDGKAKFGVSQPVDRRLSAAEQAQFNARTTARNDVPSYCVGEPYNTVVLPNPDGAGWLVWLLQPMTVANTYPITGHWRYLISADGESIVRRDRLGNSCLSMETKDKVAIMVTNIVSQAPLETHVFTSYAAKLDIFVLTGKEAMWQIHDGKIISVDPKTMEGAVEPKPKQP